MNMQDILKTIIITIARVAIQSSTVSHALLSTMQTLEKHDLPSQLLQSMMIYREGGPYANTQHILIKLVVH